jgi:mono/diheme cytochrome c family protein
MKSVIVSTFLILLIVVGHVWARTIDDTGQGLVLAQQVCSECHAILKDEVRSPNPRAPTFAELASTPGMTRAALSVALTTPHAGMPMFRFTPNQRADVIAYILSLH